MQKTKTLDSRLRMSGMTEGGERVGKGNDAGFLRCENDGRGVEGLTEGERWRVEDQSRETVVSDVAGVAYYSLSMVSWCVKDGCLNSGS